MAGTGGGDFPNAEYDYLMKIIMVGDSGVGKSALLKAFMGEDFTKHYVSTIGVDFEIKQLMMDGKRVHLQIWDTAGQERFRTITTSYYRSSDAILLAFDATDKGSFRNVDAWLEDVRAYARKGVDILLVGNKVDLEGQRAVDYEEAVAYAEENALPFLETSAKTGFNVEKAFSSLAGAALKTKVAEKDRLDEEAGAAGARGVALDDDDGSGSRRKGCC